MTSKLLEAIHEAIWEDGYLWIVVHAPPRKGKTSLALDISHAIYKDWEKVHNSYVFNLPGLIGKIENGTPCQWTTRNNLHKRVPLLIYDDFGVHSNKADTQHSTAWDIFKGGFDAIGTSLAVLIATMVNADSATTQLQNKYNAELTITERGKYKFDKITWQQDYRGFRSRIKKIFVEEGTFSPISDKEYKIYDTARMELVDEVFIRMKDAMSLDNIDAILKLLRPEDENLLRLIHKKGAIRASPELKDNITRCRSRNLILNTHRVGNNVMYDLSQLGADVLLAIDSNDKAKERIQRKGDIV